MLVIEMVLESTSHVVVDCSAGICLIKFHGQNKTTYYAASLEGEGKWCSCLHGKEVARGV